MLYGAFENDLYSTKVKLRLIAPLKNFQSEVKNIQLADNLVIRQLENKELNELWRWDPLNPNIDHFGADLLFEPYKLVFDVQFMKGQVFDIPEKQKTMEDVVTALRIFKTGLVGYNFFLVWPSECRPLRGIYDYNTNIRFNAFAKPYLGTKYELSVSEGKAFTRFWKKFKSADIQPIHVAISRLSHGEERETAEDQLIDLMIAFENLYLPDAEGELRFRLSIRASCLLEKDDAGREEVFSLLKDAYDIRSKIVHGASRSKVDRMLQKVGFSKLADLSAELQQYLRMSIKIYLNNPSQLKADALDRRLLSKR